MRQDGGPPPSADLDAVVPYASFPRMRPTWLSRVRQADPKDGESILKLAVAGRKHAPQISGGRWQSCGTEPMEPGFGAIRTRKLDNVRPTLRGDLETLPPARCS